MTLFLSPDTRYQAPSGEYRMRVTSLCYPWASVTGNPQQPLNNNELANGLSNTPVDAPRFSKALSAERLSRSTATRARVPQQ